MKKFWNNLSIRKKIMSTGMIIILIFTLFIIGFIIPVMKASVMEKKKEKIKEHVEIAYATLDYFNNKIISGEMEPEEARNAAALHIKQFRYGAGKQDYFWINDTTRPFPVMVMHPTVPALDGKVLDDKKFNCVGPENKNLFVAFADVCEKNGEGFVEYLWPKPTGKGLTEDQPKLSYVTVFKPWNWIIGTGIYIDDVQDEIRILYIQVFSINLLIIIISAIALFFITRFIVRPIRILNKALKESDLNTVIVVHSTDEVGTMASYFNRFVENIKDVVSVIRLSSAELAASSEQMTAVSLSFAESAQEQMASANEVTATINEIVNEMDSVTNDIDVQFDTLNNLVKRMEELSDLINNLNIDIQESMGLIKTISNTAKSGEQSLNEMDESITKIGSSSLEMTGIIEIINDISDKINLLSLNAAIEAARAGDSGRGFAVVADEVSKLADQTAQSIGEISRIITENDREISKGSERVKTTVKLITSIIDGVAAINTKISGISDKMLKQVGSKEIVTKEVQDVSEMSQGIRVATKVQKTAVSEINELIKKITQGTEAITAGAEQLSSSSEEVAGMAEGLKLKVDVFKV